MFASHFYHGITAKTIAAFGTIFNDIKIARKDAAGNTLNTTRVPLAYGPRFKWVARIDDQKNFNDPKTAIKLPRMSFEMTGVQYDTDAKLSKYAGTALRGSLGEEMGRDSYPLMYAPYEISTTLSIFAKTQEDGLQIVEQILPLFQPQYSVSIRYLDGLDKSFDLPITLEGVSLEDDYEGDYESRRVINYTMDFSMKVRYFGPVQDKAIIRTTDINMYDMASGKKLEKYKATVNPPDAETREEADEPILRIFTLPPTENLILTTRTPVTGGGFFVDQELVVGQISGAEAYVVRYSPGIPGTLEVEDATAEFQIGEEVVSARGATFTIDDYLIRKRLATGVPTFAAGLQDTIMSP